MRRIRLWGLFAVGIFSIILGFYSVYLQHARRDWPITGAHVLSLEYLEKSRKGPQEDRYQLEVSYRVHDSDVKAQMNDYGHPRFKVGDAISVQVDPDNLKHFVFHQPNAGSSIAEMFLIGIISISGASVFLFLKKR